MMIPAATRYGTNAIAVPARVGPTPTPTPWPNALRSSSKVAAVSQNLLPPTVGRHRERLRSP